LKRRTVVEKSQLRSLIPDGQSRVHRKLRDRRLFEKVTARMLGRTSLASPENELENKLLF
jgi:hypothetical protein